jgi:hypothetical protein
VEGVSTRKVKEITEELCGTSFSKSLVSSLAGSLDSELEGWRNRALEAEAYPYVFVDARYEKVRMDHRIVSQGVLIVSAVREPDGLREILAVEVADTESEAAYQELFRSLKARGLSGVELVVCDEHEGIKAAVARHFQGLSIRGARCTTVGTSSGWWGPTSARSSGRIYEGSSPRQRGTPPSVSPPRWPTSGERRATRRSQPTSRSTSRSASLAWPSRNPIAGASAQPTAWRGSERGAKEAYAGG